ncbi:MAG: inner membrane CreD family protein [Cyclobacteriaceae bacterium]|nr:inner membrane CreD family protein [Cyclobacteriaceae bacterium]
MRDADFFNHTFGVYLTLRGSEELYFVPIGKKTEVSMSSSWTDPSFVGAFPTKESEISEAGFTANWQVLHFNRNFPQSWTTAKYDVDESRFGVNLLVAADHYQKSLRTSKYSILIISLSFSLYSFLLRCLKKCESMRFYIFLSAWLFCHLITCSFPFQST